jgi:uncharacterized protein (DUF1501 family)
MAELPHTVSLQVDARGAITRRRFLSGLAGTGVLAGLGWSSPARAAAELRRRGRACILLWMAGGPSQFETFDPKPGADTQGPTRAIATSVPGIHVAEHWARTAAVMKELAVIRSMTSTEGNHGRASYLLHTSYAPSGGISHPGLGAQVAQELGRADFDLPLFVSIAGPSVGSSFLGVKYAPFIVTNPNTPPDNLPAPVHGARLKRRLGLLRELEAPQLNSAVGPLVRDHQALYEQTAAMVLSTRARAFSLDREPETLRDRYGRSPFGQGCLMARRLIEAGVPFVEVQSSGWDTHDKELPRLHKLIPPVDQATAALVADLKMRGLLETTLLIWMGEFGRMPRINLTAGRDHYPQAFNLFLAGAGVKGGRVIGATDKRGVEVTERPVKVADLFCTFCQALGIDPRKEKDSDVGRPIKIVEKGRAVTEVF